MRIREKGSIFNTMRKISYDLYEKYIGTPSWEEAKERNNTERLHQLQRIMGRVIAENLSERQRMMLDCYYMRQMSMPEIAALLHINKSTVSRTLSRALKNIEKYIKYYPLR